MAQYRLTGPDGSVYNVTAPDSASQDEVLQQFHANMPAAAPATPAQPSRLDAVLNQPILSLGGMSPKQAFNMGVGALRGGKDIVDTGAHGAAMLYDKATGSGEADRIRALDKAGTDQYEAKFGNIPEAKIGRVGGQAAITYPIGGVLAQGARLLGAGSKVVNGLASNGFSLGAPAAATRAGIAGDLATRAVTGAATAGAQGAVADPEHAGTIAAIGGLLPVGIRGLGAAGGALADSAQDVAKRLMESALKPTLKQKQTGDAAIAVEELLARGINPTKGGVEKIKGLISGLNEQIGNKLAASDATIDPQKVVNALAKTKQKFGNQVAPTADLNAIGNVESDFLNNGGAGDIPVQLAQKLKQGTYNTLRGKYGQLGSAETEAQKGLARGLKDEIAAAVPDVAPLNAEESRLLSTLSVTERRAMMDVNKNPLGLAALAVHEPSAFIAFMADKSAAFKSLAARAINAASSPRGRGVAQNALERSSPPLLRSGLAASDQGARQ